MNEKVPKAATLLVINFAREDALAFVREFGEHINPAATDWDAVAWQFCKLGQYEVIRDELWPIYSRELYRASTELKQRDFRRQTKQEKMNQWAVESVGGKTEYLHQNRASTPEEAERTWRRIRGLWFVDVHVRRTTPEEDRRLEELGKEE